MASSPIKKPLRSNHAAHVRHDVQSFVVPDNEEDLSLARFWEMLEYSAHDFKNYDLSNHWRPKEDFGEYMNEISKSILRSLPDLGHNRLILFQNTSRTSPLDHPTGTKCRPDFVACPEAQKGNIHWTEIDATVEIHSAGDNAKNGPRHAGSYTLYLLQARPDRVSVQGFYADAKGVILIISSSDGIKKSPKLNLKDAKKYQLIYAFVKRLYDPHPSMIDPTVKRRKDITRKQIPIWVFDIMLTIPNSPSVECVGYRIEKAMDPVGRRTHIFVNNVNPTLLNGVAITVIKDQYCYGGHRFNEADVLRHVHREEEIPGVVHLAHSSDVIRSDGTPVCSGGRQKKRIGLVEYGKLFMDLKTPLEVLKAIFDLLETTRLLYFKRDILHRDISAGNLLYIEKDCPTATALTKNTSQELNFCFIKHLLDPNVAPSATVNLLVDFDRGEIRKMRQDKSRLARTGTPIFMARAIRAGRPLGVLREPAMYMKVPELSQKAHVYEDVFPDRLKRFQHNPGSLDDHLVRIGAPPDSPLPHELRHDAESAFWLLVWWVVTAAPADGCTSEIPSSLWGAFSDTIIDARSPALLESSCLDPAYAPLFELLDQLGKALKYDLYWATDTPYTLPDFLHEVLQRHILNFIFENQDKDFMKLAKADASRKPAKSSMNSSLSAEETDSNRSRSVGKHSRETESEPESETSKKSRQ